MERGQAYITALGAAVTTALGIGLLGFAGGVVVALGIVGALVAYLYVTEDANGRSRFLVPGALALAVALLPGVSEAAGEGVPSDPSVGISNLIAWAIGATGVVVGGVCVLMLLLGGGEVGTGNHRSGLKRALGAVLGIALAAWAASGQAQSFIISKM